VAATRRQFLVGASAVALGSSGLARAATARRVIARTDIRYLGSFRMPPSAMGQDAAWGRALAHRVVGGAHRFLASTVPGGVFEVREPRLARRAPYPVAPIVREWGDVTQGRRDLDGGRGSGGINGLYWDEGTKRLFWSYGDGYNTTSGRDPSLGAATLDNARAISKALGVWRLEGRSCKMTQGGILAIPRAFADRYCQGRRLGAGFGGYFSIATVGPISMGPALSAFSPQDCTPARDRNGVPSTTLLGYPFNAEPYATPGRCERDADYRTEFDGWQPRGDVGYWTWADYLWQGGVWIDQPGLHGVLFFPTLGNGRTWYETSTLHAERATHWCFVYDPADLARVASGRRQQWQIQPHARFRMRFPDLPEPLPGWANEPENMVVGTAYHQATRRLFVSVRDTRQGHLVHAYRIGT
jgi:hypothetical protein